MPSASLILAQVWRLTTTHLILVRSPSRYSGYGDVEKLADDGAQNGVAEKLQPLVRGQPVLGARGVGQSGAQQRFVVERIADAPLTTGQFR